MQTFFWAMYVYAVSSHFSELAKLWGLCSSLAWRCKLNMSIPAWWSREYKSTRSLVVPGPPFSSCNSSLLMKRSMTVFSSTFLLHSIVLWNFVFSLSAVDFHHNTRLRSVNYYALAMIRVLLSRLRVFNKALWDRLLVGVYHRRADCWQLFFISVAIHWSEHIRKRWLVLLFLKHRCRSSLGGVLYQNTTSWETLQKFFFGFLLTDLMRFGIKRL